jgi:pimeloyl-ACP methyl ester carboxylesterase
MAQGSVVDDEDVAEVLSRLPGATIVPLEGAGHSVQGDQPVALAHLLSELP